VFADYSVLATSGERILQALVLIPTAVGSFAHVPARWLSAGLQVPAAQMAWIIRAACAVLVVVAIAGALILGIPRVPANAVISLLAGLAPWGIYRFALCMASIREDDPP
jgi:hypothetical protein